MTSNTENAEVSSTAPAQNEESAEAKAARVDLIKKAVARIDEVSDRVDMITRAMTGAIPELIKNHSLGEIIDTFTTFEDAADRVSKSVIALAKIVSYAREVSLPERLDGDEIKTFTADSGDRMTRTSRIFASIIPEQKDGAFEWLRANDYQALIQETVNSSSLSAAAKELIENGMELPDHLFNSHYKDGVSITRKKKG